MLKSELHITVGVRRRTIQLVHHKKYTRNYKEMLCTMADQN